MANIPVLASMTKKFGFYFECGLDFCGFFPTICNAFDLTEQRCSLHEGWELSHGSDQAENLPGVWSDQDETFKDLIKLKP